MNKNIDYYDLEACRHELQSKIDEISRNLASAISRIETIISRTDQEIIRIGERMTELEVEVFDGPN